MSPEVEYVKYLLGFANIFISLFIIIFAVIFLRKTEPHENRKPWSYMLVAVIVYFLFEVLSVVGVFSTSILPELKDFFKTFFVAIVLYVFVYQHYLISKSNKILIRRKVEEIDKLKSKKKSKHKYKSHF